MSWSRLGGVPLETLSAARQTLHHAAQTIAAAGETFVPHRPDPGHTALVWLESHRALASAEIAGRWPCRLALRVADLTLLLLDRQGAPHAQLALEGQTSADANAWAAEAIRVHTHGERSRPLVHPGFQIPGKVERFVAPRAELAELGRWYANADAELCRLALRTPGAGPVLCWPHHFDIATLIELGGGKTIGVGLSPGDEGIAEPYGYVNYFPAQPGRALPLLDAGEWNTTGWVGALLRGSALVQASAAGAQQELWRRFVASAVAASQRLLESGDESGEDESGDGLQNFSSSLSPSGERMNK